jgi:uncharacterized Zn finger protein
MQTRTRRPCGVCGGHEVSLDEVLDAGVLCLGECERCGHLWTERALLAVPRAFAAALREVAEAA